MTEVALPALVGTNPLGFLAALGALDVVSRTVDGDWAALRWDGELRPTAVLRGVRDVDELVAMVDRDRSAWAESALLRWGPGGAPIDDVKLRPDDLVSWAEEMLDAPPEIGAVFCALVAEGAVAGKGDAKPTDLHFTAGQQRFLGMVRHLAHGVTAAAVVEALSGPWRRESSLPTLGWDARGERIWALRASDPSKEPKSGEAGADWLAFVGLSLLPVFAQGTRLRTTGCAGTWKRGRFRWPLWDCWVDRRVAQSLLGDPRVLTMPSAQRRALGVTALLEAPIRRTDQGGYGSFGPTTAASARGFA